MARDFLCGAAMMAGAMIMAVWSTPALAQSQPRAVLELFTSQGCSSCPPADELLGELALDSDVLAVTLPVKLWDFLGWQDTLATQQNTDRQMAYSVARGDRDVYTPQMMVNGELGVVASDRDAVEAAINESADAMTLPIFASVENDVLSISIPSSAEGPVDVTLWLLVVEDEVTVPIGAGENRGRKLVYHNVVREMRPMGMWKGRPMQIDLPLTDLKKSESFGCIIIAQEHTFRGPGRIIGAAAVDKLFPGTAMATAEQ